MSTTDASGQPSTDTERDRERTPVGRWALRSLAVLGVLSGLLWVGAILFGGSVKPKGFLEDRTFPTAAEPICARAMKDLKQFPPANRSKDPVSRAEVIEQTTDRLEKMLAELRQVVPDSADRRWIDQWIDDWGVHLSDRRDFARRLRANGRSEEFFESEKYGGQISRPIDRNADINRMPSCATPGDV